MKCRSCGVSILHAGKDHFGPPTFIKATGRTVRLRCFHTTTFNVEVQLGDRKAFLSPTRLRKQWVGF